MKKPAIFIFSLVLLCLEGCVSTGNFYHKKNHNTLSAPSSATKKSTVTSVSPAPGRKTSGDKIPPPAHHENAKNGNAAVAVADDSVDRGEVKENPEVFIIKIGIVVNAQGFNISGDDYVIASISVPSENNRIKGKSDDYFVSVRGGISSGGKISIGSESYTAPVMITPSETQGRIRINGKSYRGKMVVRLLKNNRLTVINEIDIEDYLKGVLPSEMNPAWPLEALKAQSVAARSFAWKNLNRHSDEGFDLCATVHCQVYSGFADKEDARITRAVEETRGEILIDPSNGDTANAVFHACCGGYTEDPANVWDLSGARPPSYLVPRRCPYCRDYPHFNWTSTLDAGFIRDRLNQNGWKVGNIKNIEIAGRNVSGRVRFFRIIHSGGKTAVPGGKFRLAVDPWKIKSTRISNIVRRGNGIFEFKGQGWGHGVGMCQAGAKGMAEDGRNYRDILGFYYKGAVVGKMQLKKSDR